MKYLLEPGSYLIDREELNKISRKQTALNALIDLIKPFYSKDQLETLYPDKHIHSEFQALKLIGIDHSNKLKDQDQILNRLKPLERRIKNLNSQERYLLLILQFCLSDKEVLIIDNLSFIQESNLVVLNNLIESSLKLTGKTLFIIDRKEKLWKKGFHYFETHSLVSRPLDKIAS